MWHSIAAHGPAARTLAVHSLAVFGWLRAIVNWVRIRHLQRIQEELLRRLFNPPRTRYAPGIGAFLAIGLAVEGADLVAWRMKSWVIVRFGVELVAVWGWLAGFWVWRNYRALRGFLTPASVL